MFTAPVYRSSGRVRPGSRGGWTEFPGV